jgi:hypothetical protein
MTPVVLPAARPEGREALSRWDSEGGAVSRPGTGRSLRFLVVSADPLISLPLATSLNGIGHQVCAIALTNDQAVKSAAICHPDMIIADAYLEDDARLIDMAPVVRALFVPRMFNDGMPVPRSLLRPGAVVLRRPFRASDLIRAIRLTLKAAE